MKGLDVLLDKIAEDPTKKIMKIRFLALVSELEDSTEKASWCLKLAKKYGTKFPKEALQVAYMVCNYDVDNIEALCIMIDSLDELGNSSQANKLRDHLSKVRAELANSSDHNQIIGELSNDNSFGDDEIEQTNPFNLSSDEILSADAAFESSYQPLKLQRPELDLEAPEDVKKNKPVQQNFHLDLDVGQDEGVSDKVPGQVLSLSLEENQEPEIEPNNFGNVAVFNLETNFIDQDVLNSSDTSIETSESIESGLANQTMIHASEAATDRSVESQQGLIPTSTSDNGNELGDSSRLKIEMEKPVKKIKSDEVFEFDEEYPETQKNSVEENVPSSEPSLIDFSNEQDEGEVLNSNVEPEKPDSVDLFSANSELTLQPENKELENRQDEIDFEQSANADLKRENKLIFSEKEPQKEKKSFTDNTTKATESFETEIDVTDDRDLDRFQKFENLKRANFKNYDSDLISKMFSYYVEKDDIKKAKEILESSAAFCSSETWWKNSFNLLLEKGGAGLSTKKKFFEDQDQLYVVERIIKRYQIPGDLSPWANLVEHVDAEKSKKYFDALGASEFLFFKKRFYLFYLDLAIINGYSRLVLSELGQVKIDLSDVTFRREIFLRWQHANETLGYCVQLDSFLPDSTENNLAENFTKISQLGERAFKKLLSTRMKPDCDVSRI